MCLPRLKNSLATVESEVSANSAQLDNLSGTAQLTDGVLKVRLDTIESRLDTIVDMLSRQPNSQPELEPEPVPRSCLAE